MMLKRATVLPFTILFFSSPCFAIHYTSTLVRENGGHYTGPAEYRIPLMILSIIVFVGGPILLAMITSCGGDGDQSNKKTYKDDSQKAPKDTMSTVKYIFMLIFGITLALTIIFGGTYHYMKSVPSFDIWSVLANLYKML